ncbi:MAG: hypothetical protein P9L95_08575, partial [Candidatus Tenebribacter mawsonii]|nr:hypothetical protein [Candidatus Tenebribacter mawsonii]
MKKLVILIAVALFSYAGIAQEQTLLGGEIENGGYGAFFTRVGQVNGGTGVFMGGQGAWIMNHRLGFGGKGYALISPTDLSDIENVKLEFGCWGGLIEYIIASDQLLHLNVHTMIGAGGVRYSPIDYSKEHPEIDYSEDAMFVIEPGID